MAQVVLAEGVRDDFDRILRHLEEFGSSAGRIGALIAALDVLETSPRIGRPVEAGMRELVIGTGAAGYIALYRYLAADDLVVVVALRSQREAGYRQS